MFRSECENKYIRVVSKTMVTSGNENDNENGNENDNENGNENNVEI